MPACSADMFSFNSLLSDTASLHPRGLGLSHSALLRGGPLRGHHDCRGRGHHVCAEDRHVHGEDTPTGTAEAADPHCEYIQLVGHF